MSSVCPSKPLNELRGFWEIEKGRAVLGKSKDE